MSYKVPKKIRATTYFYMNRIIVDVVDEKNVWIGTGPYRKDLCGKNLDGITMYYNHLKEIYMDGKKKRSMKPTKEELILAARASGNEQRTKELIEKIYKDEVLQA